MNLARTTGIVVGFLAVLTYGNVISVRLAVLNFLLFAACLVYLVFTWPNFQWLVVAMLNPESNRETHGPSRAVGSQAQDSGRYQHLACTRTEIFNKGDILRACPNPSCPNKGANWTLQEKLT